MVAGLIVFDHAGLLGSTGNDWARFDQQTFPVVEIISGDEIIVRSGHDDIPVRLLSIDAPDAGLIGNAEAVAYTRERLKDRSVTLRLEPTQTRDASRALLAYVYLTDSDDLNLDLIHDGMAYADRRVKHTLAGLFEQREAEARKKFRGLWNGLRTEDMPAWRQAWLKALIAERTDGR